MFSLTAIASAITKTETVVEGAIAAVTGAITAVQSLVSSVKTLVAYVPTLMETFENAYAAVGDANNGAGKLAGVLAALQAVAAKIAVDWNDTIKAVIANIIAQAKAAWNAVTSIGASSATTATAATTAAVTTAEAAAA